MVFGIMFVNESRSVAPGREWYKPGCLVLVAGWKEASSEWPRSVTGIRKEEMSLSLCVLVALTLCRGSLVRRVSRVSAATCRIRVPRGKTEDAGRRCHSRGMCEAVYRCGCGVAGSGWWRTGAGGEMGMGMGMGLDWDWRRRPQVQFVWRRTVDCGSSDQWEGGKRNWRPSPLPANLTRTLTCRASQNIMRRADVR